MSSTYQASLREKYPLTRTGKRQINVRVDQRTWTQLMQLKERSGDTSTVGSWYGRYIRELIEQQAQAKRGAA